MANYGSVQVEWLILIFNEGYVALLDADRQELIDAIFES